MFSWTWTKASDGHHFWKQGEEYAGPTEDEAALLAKDIYLQKASVSACTYIPKVEQTEVEGTEYSLVRIDAGKEGFKAGVYKRTIQGEDFYAIVYEGTTDNNDWYTNIKQGAGLPDAQYEYAVSLADANSSCENVTMVGHSLGGGLASLAALTSERNAITFNAAGLSDYTMGRYNVKGKSTSKIDAYVIQGEILNTSLQLINQGAIGNLHKLLPASLKPYIEDPDPYESAKAELNYSIRLHSMEEVIKSLNSR